MGASSSEPGFDLDEGPIHRVDISRGFWFGTCEVTQAQWKAVMGSNPSKFQSSDQRPVERVSWIDVQLFLQKLNRKAEDVHYRLPTEAEWEYACSAGTRTLFSFGDGLDDLKEYAWTRENSNKRTRKIGQLKPNPWGLFDMHGNVLEWCLDKYYEHYYAESSATDPQGPEIGSGHVYRGGSWNNKGIKCRSAKRRSHNQGHRSENLGFRLVAMEK